MTEPTEPPWPPMPPAVLPIVVNGPASPRSSAGDEHEARAAQLRKNIRFTLVTRILHPAAPPLDESALGQLIDWVLLYYAGDLGALIADAEAHRRRVASLKKRPTTAEMFIVGRLREKRQLADLYDRYPEIGTKEQRRRVENPVAALAEELQRDLAELDRDDPQRGYLDEIYRILRKGSTRVLEMYDRVLPAYEAMLARSPPEEDDPPDTDEDVDN